MINKKKIMIKKMNITLRVGGEKGRWWTWGKKTMIERGTQTLPMFKELHI
jgi:hypothetical protein